MTSPSKLLIALAFGLSSLVTFEPASANGGVRTVALTGDAAPGTAPGVTFNTFADIDAAPVLNNSGQVAFTRHLSGTGGFANDSGIWSEGGGTGLGLVAREGTIAPGTTVVFGDFYGSQILMNSASQTAVYASLATSQPGVNSTNFRGIWSEGHGSGLALIARSGSPAPGTSRNFDDTFSNLVLNDSGQTAFSSSLARPSINDPITRGVWSEGHGSGLALLVSSGSAAPGTAAGVSFSFFDRLVLNNSGNTAFRAVVTGSGVNLTNDDGIWSEGGAGR